MIGFILALAFGCNETETLDTRSEWVQPEGADGPRTDDLNEGNDTSDDGEADEALDGDEDGDGEGDGDEALDGEEEQPSAGTDGDADIAGTGIDGDTGTGTDPSDPGSGTGTDAGTGTGAGTGTDAGAGTGTDAGAGTAALAGLGKKYYDATCKDCHDSLTITFDNMKGFDAAGIKAAFAKAPAMQSFSTSTTDEQLSQLEAYFAGEENPAN